MLPSMVVPVTDHLLLVEGAPSHRRILYLYDRPPSKVIAAYLRAASPEDAVLALLPPAAGVHLSSLRRGSSAPTARPPWPPPSSEAPLTVFRRTLLAFVENLPPSSSARCVVQAEPSTGEIAAGFDAALTEWREDAPSL